MTKKIFLLLALIFFMSTTNVEAAEENNSAFDIVASTYAEGAPDALALVKMKSDNSLYFMVATDNKQFALIPYSRKVYDFYMNKGESGYPPLIFLMLVMNQQRGQLDDNLGEWKDNMHGIPVYVIFNVEGNQLHLNETFWSGEGTLAPSHFHSEIKNPTHIKLIRAFISNMPALHEQIDAKKATSP